MKIQAPSRWQCCCFFAAAREMMTYLNGAVDVAAGVFEDVLESLAAGLGLVGNAATNKVTLSVGGNLT
jgi:hypothetical protein